MNMSNCICVGVFDPDYTPLHKMVMDGPDFTKLIPQMMRDLPRQNGKPATQTQLAKRICSGRGKVFDQSLISRWKSGIMKPERPHYDWIIATARELGSLPEPSVSSEDIAATIDGSPPRMLQVKGFVQAGGHTQFYAMNPGDDFGEIPARDKDGPNAAAVEIKGSSLGQFFNGWYAIYDDVRHPFTTDMVGEPCVVGLDDGRILIKKVKQGRGGQLDLYSNVDDEKEPPIRDVRIEWAALVTDFRKR